ncbi:MAG: hypothetical protein ABI840_01480, partial [bacterium]
FTLAFAINVKAQIPSYTLAVTNRIFSADLTSATFDIVIHTPMQIIMNIPAHSIFSKSLKNIR